LPVNWLRGEQMVCPTPGLLRPPQVDEAMTMYTVEMETIRCAQGVNCDTRIRVICDNY